MSGHGGAVVAAPMRLEAWLIGRGAPRLAIHRTGIGPHRARAAALELSARRPSPLIVMGLAGGLEHGSQPGEVIVADELLDSDGGRRACEGADTLASALADAGIAVRRGAVVSVSRFAVGEERARLRGLGAIAVDMESVWLADGAVGGHFGVVRVVADTPAREVWRPWLTATGLVTASLALRRAAAAIEHRLSGDGPPMI
jgi:4-hydroxy-3-methylbut-2-enyl diphosphate reductase